jgi:hypothetical protein
MDRPITQADTVLAVWYEDVGRCWHIPKLILAAWPDGHVVWSRNRVEGGPPYYMSDVEPQTIAAALTRFKEDGIFACRNLRRSRGPSADSPSQVLLLRFGLYRLKMETVHELYAGAPMVTLDQTPAILTRGTPVEALERESASALHFRLIWCELRRSLDDLIPASGELIDGELVMEGDRRFWREP